MILSLTDNWQTFQGKVLKVSQLDHQHLSNIYWYYKIVVGGMEEFCHSVIEISEQQFNGQILPYRPHTQFSSERSHLLRAGLIKRNELTGTDEVWYGGIKVGEYLPT